MNIDIHSFQSALVLKPNVNERTIMIRISDPDYAKERDAELMYREEYVDVLKVSFHDLTDQQISSILRKEPEAPYCTMSPEQADTILFFVEQHRECDRLVVHCSAGISRSSAVAWGVARFLHNSLMEKEIQESDFYLPNQTVKERLIEAMKRRGSFKPTTMAGYNFK